MNKHAILRFFLAEFGVCVQSAAHVFGITRRPEPRVAREWLGRGEAACSVASQNSPYGGLWVKGARRAIFLSSFSSFSPRAASGRAIKNLSTVKRIYVHAAAFPLFALCSLLCWLCASWCASCSSILLAACCACTVLCTVQSAVSSMVNSTQHSASASASRARARALSSIQVARAAHRLLPRTLCSS